MHACDRYVKFSMLSNGGGIERNGAYYAKFDVNFKKRRGAIV